MYILYARQLSSLVTQRTDSPSEYTASSTWYLYQVDTCVYTENQGYLNSIITGSVHTKKSLENPHSPSEASARFLVMCTFRALF